MTDFTLTNLNKPQRKCNSIKVDYHTMIRTKGLKKYGQHLSNTYLTCICPKHERPIYKQSL